jgi:hypothetical protein
LRSKTTPQRPRETSSARDKHLKELMKQAVREVMAELDEDAWDRQITADAEAGKLDALIQEARDEIREGQTEPIVFDGSKIK